MVQADGDVELKGESGSAEAHSTGGSGMVVSWDDKGFNAAGASPGESWAKSGRNSDHRPQVKEG